MRKQEQVVNTINTSNAISSLTALTQVHSTKSLCIINIKLVIVA